MGTGMTVTISRIFGYGVLSGSQYHHTRNSRHPSQRIPKSTIPFTLLAAQKNTSVEGITIADSAYHSLMLIGPPKPEARNRYALVEDLYVASEWGRY